MAWLTEIIEIKPIELASVVAGVGTVIWFITNRYYKNKDNLRALRVEAYKGFLNKLDEAGNASRSSFADVLRLSNSMFARIMQDPGNSNETLIEFNDNLSNLTNESVKGWSILSNEINQLTLVCSRTMLPLVEEYKELTKKVMDNTQTVLASINFLDPTAQSQIQSVISKVDQDRLVTLHAEIKKLMRKEIGND